MIPVRGPFFTILRNLLVCQMYATINESPHRKCDTSFKILANSFIDNYFTSKPCFKNNSTVLGSWFTFDKYWPKVDLYDLSS